jgi:CheY-like chemotaxis protein
MRHEKPPRNSKFQRPLQNGREEAQKGTLGSLFCAFCAFSRLSSEFYHRLPALAFSLQPLAFSLMNKTILLIEDNPDDADLTLRALKQHHIGNDLVLASDGAEALDYLFGTGAHAGRDVRQMPQLVLLDLKLPKVDGFEVLRRLRADGRTRYLPVVVLTSSKEEQDLIQAYRHQANSYIRKPVDFIQFAEAIRLLGMYWLVLNELPPAGAGETGKAKVES